MTCCGQDNADIAISGVDAVRLLDIKHILPRKTTVSIQATVTAVSEIVRINKDSVFLVGLEGGSNIVVKQPHFHKWHQRFVIGRSFVFTNLRPTTLSKSHIVQQRVFVPWVGSKLLPHNLGSTLFSCLSLQDWLSRLGLSTPIDDGKEQCGDSNREVDINIDDGSTSYQGVITDSSQSDIRMFEVEHNVDLFLCFLPELQQPKQLNVGDFVTIHNVHHSVCAKTQKKQLFCCMKSSIAVTQKQGDGEGKVAGGEQGTGHWQPYPVSLLSQYVFTQRQAAGLLQLYRDVCHLVNHPINPSNREGEDGLKAIMQYLLKSKLYPPQKQPRNYLLEFCQHQTCCPLSINADEKMNQIAQLIPLTELIQDLRNSRDRKTESAQGYVGLPMLSSSNEDNLWTFKSQYYSEKVEKRLLGRLTINPTSGQLQLVDSQTSVDVVIVDSEAASVSQTHLDQQPFCDRDLCLDSRLALCRHVQPYLLGRLIHVKNCSIVLETFRQDQKTVDSTSEDKSMFYLLLSVQDCVRIQHNSFADTGCGQGSTRSKFCGQCLGVKRTAEKSGSRLFVREDESFRHVYITEKHHLCSRTLRKSGGACLQFYAEGVFVSPKNCETDNTDDSQSQRDCKQCDDVAGPARKVRKLMAVEGIPGSSGKVTVSCDSSQPIQASKFPMCSFNMEHPVSLVFEGESCRWFDLIQPHVVYRFVGEKNDSPLQQSQVDPKLQAAMKNAGTRTLYRVSTSAAVDDMICDCSNNNIISIPSLQSVLTDCCNGNLQSLRGIVTWRHHPSSLFPEPRTGETSSDNIRQGKQCMENSNATIDCFMGCKSIRIVVRDVDDPSVTASVYFKTSMMIYPKGLLPGAVVDFDRLDKKMSKSCNTYFTFLPVSSFCVRHAPSGATMYMQTTDDKTDHGRDWESPKLLLVDVWQQPHNSHHMFLAACHIYQVLRLTLKSQCVQCQSLFQPEGCSSPACSNTSLSQLCAKVSMLVDDGTCQALVHINKGCSTDVVRRLFLMSTDQWSQLDTAIQRHGELFLQKFGFRGGTCVEDLMSLLCDSNKFKRPCWFILRKSFTPKNRMTAGKHRDTTSLFETLKKDDLFAHKVNTGEAVVDTLALPYLHLDCLDVKEL